LDLHVPKQNNKSHDNIVHGNISRKKKRLAAVMINSKFPATWLATRLRMSVPRLVDMQPLANPRYVDRRALA